MDADTDEFHDWIKNAKKEDNLKTKNNWNLIYMGSHEPEIKLNTNHPDLKKLGYNEEN